MIHFNAETRTFALQLETTFHAFQVDAVLCYRLTPEHDIIERWCEVVNPGSEPVEVESLSRHSQAP